MGIPKRDHLLRFGTGLYLVLVCMITAHARAQTASGPKYTLDVEDLGPSPDDAAASVPLEQTRRPTDRYPSYGYSYRHPYEYGYDYRAYGGYPYGYPWGVMPYRIRQWGPDGRPFLMPGRPFVGPWIDDDERQWRRWYLARRTKTRSSRLKQTHDLMMARGVAAFAAGDYEQARSGFVLAASTNVYDAASRVHAAHSCFALGRYDQAVRWLREAFRLEPRIRELPYDIRSDYGNPADFDAHLGALKATAAALPGEAEPLIMLGYVHYYTGQRAEAHRALTRASQRLARNAPEAELIAGLLENCAPSRYAANKAGSDRRRTTQPTGDSPGRNRLGQAFYRVQAETTSRRSTD